MKSVTATQDGPVPDESAPEQAPEPVEPQTGGGETNGHTVPSGTGSEEHVHTAIPEQAPRTSVMLLGSGEIAREMVLAFQRLGADVTVVDHGEGGPALGAANWAADVALDDAMRLAEFIEHERPAHVVPLAESVATDVLEKLSNAKVTQVVPTPKAVRLAVDREGMRRLAAEELGLPTPAYWFADSLGELRKVLELSGSPSLIRPVAAAYGVGQTVVLREGDIEPAWDRALAASLTGGKRVMVETAVETDHEIALLTARTQGVGAAARLYFCEPIGCRRVSPDALRVWQPQVLSRRVMEVARSIAARIVNALGGHGVYSVELFIQGDDVYFNDVSARPVHSGLVTLRTQRLSAFDMHARSVLGLPLDTALVSPGAAEVVYGTGPGPSSRQVGAALQVPESDVRLFASPDDTRRHAVGVGFTTAADVATAVARVAEVGRHLR